MAQYNLKNPAVKRLMKEAAELQSPTEEYYAQPLEDNLFEWHFTLRGPPNTEFENGFYHGRITLPPDYPMKPPSIILLTPNGRFETNKKICLSISGHHPETWRPSWSIRTALLAIIGFMPTHGNGAIGSLDYTPEERKHLALKSQSWKCPECGSIKNVLKVEDAEESSENPASSENQSEVKAGASTEECGIRASGSNASIPLSESVASEGHSSNLKPTQTHSSENSNVSSSETVPHLRRKPPHTDTAEASSPLPVERRNRSDFCSLVFMSVIATILVILIARRLFYQ